MIFHDRIEAGQRLAHALGALDTLKTLKASHKSGLVQVLGIPRGGVVVAAEVAKELAAPLDIWVVRKIGAPGNPEFAIGSVAADGEAFLDQASIGLLGIRRAWLEEEILRQKEEIARRLTQYRGHAKPVEVRGKIVILVDDGIATGATALSALASLKRAGAATRILAVPVAPPEVAQTMREEADETVILGTPDDFSAVGQFYEQFSQVADEEVIRLLRPENF